MPKKNGITKTFSFKPEIVQMIEFLGEYYALKKTSVIEFLVKERYREVTDCETKTGRKFNTPGA